jgi:serine/threonine protein kinase
MVMGTPDYMPPEQAQGEPADFRSDIYSLGVVLFESFTGHLPFTGDTIMKIVLAHIQNPPPRPRSVNPRIPADLEARDPEVPREGPEQALPEGRRAARSPDLDLVANERGCLALRLAKPTAVLTIR